LQGEEETVDWWVASAKGGEAVKVGLSEVLGRMNIHHPQWGEYRAPTWESSGTQIVFAARSGDSTGPLEQVTGGAGRNYHPTLSADGRKLLFISNRSGNFDVWMKDLTSGREIPIVTNPGNDYRALISPDGESVVYGRREGEGVAIFTSPLRRAGEKKLIEISGGLATWSSDGKKILYWSDKPIRFHSIDIASGETGDFIRHPEYDIHTARFSPDDRYVSFKLVMPGRDSIHIAPVRDGVAADQQEWIQVTDGHMDARSWWSPDGNLLYFLSSRDGFLCVWARPLDPVSKTPNGPVREIHHFHERHRIGTANDVGYAMIADSLYLGLDETTGDVWMARPRDVP
jgi:TolB protein